MKGKEREAGSSDPMLERLLKLGDIGRRYFVVNSFDGVLTVLGIVMGTFISNISNPYIPITTGMGALVALGISGFSSAYLAERAERRKDLSELENRMLKDLKGTYHEKRIRKLSFKISMVNGIAPFVTGLVCVFPFVLVVFDIISMDIAYGASMGVSLAVLSFLGYFLGSVSKGRRLISAIKMLFVGIATALILYLLGGF